jgi:hypothetical protein
MTVRVSTKASKSEIVEAVKKVTKQRSKKVFNAKKYLGKVVRGIDGLEYQKMVRDEWR